MVHIITYICIVLIHSVYIYKILHTSHNSIIYMLPAYGQCMHTISAYGEQSGLTVAVILSHDHHMTCSCVDESLYDPRDVLHVQRDLWYCSKFVKHTRGNEVTAYERMVSGEQRRAEPPSVLVKHSLPVS